MTKPTEMTYPPSRQHQQYSKRYYTNFCDFGLYMQILFPSFKFILISKFSKMLHQQKKLDPYTLHSESKDACRRGRWKREKQSGPSIFIAKAFEILQNQTYSDIVCWNEEGTHFTILDVQRFEQEILPAYFRHKNFSSFVRQLNMYDFHKIRNELNKNIFEHREFRRDARHLLRNIKRKGCTNKKTQEYIEDQSEEENTPYEAYEDHEEKHEALRPTLAVIENRSQIEIKPKDNPMKQHLLEDFIASLPEIVESEQKVREIIRDMKRDSKYNILNSKEDIRNVVHRIRKNKMRKERDDGLQELSIEEEIMVENVDDRERRFPSLAILSSENFLPPKTQQLICSLMLCDEKN